MKIWQYRSNAAFVCIAVFSWDGLGGMGAGGFRICHSAMTRVNMAFVPPNEVEKSGRFGHSAACAFSRGGRLALRRAAARREGRNRIFPATPIFRPCQSDSGGLIKKQIIP